MVTIIFFLHNKKIEFITAILLLNSENFQQNMNNIDSDSDNLAEWSDIMLKKLSGCRYGIDFEKYRNDPFAKLVEKFKLRNKTGEHINVQSFCQHGDLLFVVSGTSVQAYSSDTKEYLFTFEKDTYGSYGNGFDPKMITTNQNLVFVLSGRCDVFVHDTNGKFIRKFSWDVDSEKFKGKDVMKIMCTADYFCVVYFLDGQENPFFDANLIWFDLQSNKKRGCKLPNDISNVLIKDQNRLIIISHSVSFLGYDTIFDLKTKQISSVSFVQSDCDLISNAVVQNQLINLTGKFGTEICKISLPEKIKYCSNVAIFRDCFDKKMQFVHHELNKIEQRSADNAMTNCFANDLIEIVESYVPIESDQYIILIAELNGNEFSEYHLRM